MKKALVFLSVLMLALTLCACGQKDATDPTESPTLAPTEVTQTPTEEATQAPTEEPSAEPTEAPTEVPTTKATAKPTAKPATKATAKPTTKPTEKPTTKPTTCSHSYKDATCTTPKTCTKCGATQGSAKGHSWESATCTNPKTCSVCGKTEGSAKGHSWKNATCTDPKTCKTCGETSGSAKGHSWKNATCTDPKTCKTCGETSGSAKGHDYKDGVCSRCNEKDSNYTKTYSAGETWVVDGQFEFTVNSVTRHSICDDGYTESNYGIGNSATAAVIVSYTYKNLGSDKLEIDDGDVDVYDANGTEGDALFFNNYCDHGVDSKSCIAGGSCNVKLPVALEHDGDSVTIYIETYVGGKTRKATFTASVDKASEEEIQTQKGYSQVKGEFTYKYNDFVGTRGDGGARVLFVPKNTALKTQDNKSAMMLVSGKYDNGIVVEKCDGYGKFDTGDEVITAGEYVVIVISKNTTRANAATVDELKSYLGDYISDADLESLALAINYSKCAIDTMELKKGYVHTISNDFGITYF